MFMNAILASILGPACLILCRLWIQ